MVHCSKGEIGEVFIGKVARGFNAYEGKINKKANVMHKLKNEIVYIFRK